MANYNKIGKRATKVIHEGNQTVIQYHRTPVVTFNDNFITLNTGGWFTVTTKARMNQASNQFNLGYHVYQENFKWFVDFRGSILPFIAHQLRLTRELI